MLPAEVKCIEQVHGVATAIVVSAIGSASLRRCGRWPRELAAQEERIAGPCVPGRRGRWNRFWIAFANCAAAAEGTVCGILKRVQRLLGKQPPRMRRWLGKRIIGVSNAATLSVWRQARTKSAYIGLYDIQCARNRVAANGLKS